MGPNTIIGIYNSFGAGRLLLNDAMTLLEDKHGIDRKTGSALLKSHPRYYFPK